MYFTYIVTKKKHKHANLSFELLVVKESAVIFLNSTIQPSRF